MSKSTPGPWHAVIAPNDQPSLLYAGIISTLFYSPDDYVAVVSDEPLGMRDETSLLAECQANASLIAAAPILKTALIRISVLAYDASNALDVGKVFDANVALGQIADVIHDAVNASTPPLSGEAGNEAD